MAYAHVRGETVLATALDGAETLNPLLERSSSPTHDRRKVALERQRAIAIAGREMDRKRANLQALQEIDGYGDAISREKALARREETLRETGYGIATTTDDLEKREAATVQRETKLREQEDLHAELLRTAAQLREVTHAELNQAQLLRQTEAQLDERREAAHTFEELAVEREVGLRAAELQVAEHRELRTEAEARARQAEASRAEAQQQPPTLAPAAAASNSNPSPKLYPKRSEAQQQQPPTLTPALSVTLNARRRCSSSLQR